MTMNPQYRIIRGIVPETAYRFAWYSRLIVEYVVRRIERFEAELAPPSDKPALTIIVTSPGKPDWTIEVQGTEPTGRRRPWPRYGGRDR
jgi:hypothetical protein